MDKASVPLTIWTIGHSTRSIEEFIDLLKEPGIRSLVDVRRFPASRRYPHFNGTLLAQSLKDAGIQYHHMPALGGRRPARRDSPNIGWRNAGFRGYADYMETDEFWEALEELMASAETRPSTILPTRPGRTETRPSTISPTCPGRTEMRPSTISPTRPGRTEMRPSPMVIMCAEAVPWRCHRNLIADALVTRGWRVLHIISANRTDTHTLTSFATVSGDKLLYPSATGQSSLF
ncbi:DUF488 domain-containing protein [Nitrospira sp. Nam80]